VTRQIPATSRQETPAPKSALGLRSTPAHIRLQNGAIALNSDGILHGILSTPPTLKLQTTHNTYIRFAGGTYSFRLIHLAQSLKWLGYVLDDPGSESRKRKPLVNTGVLGGGKAAGVRQWSHTPSRRGSEWMQLHLHFPQVLPLAYNQRPPTALLYAVLCFTTAALPPLQ